MRHFAELAFAEVGLELAWQGSGVEEVGIDSKSERILVRVDPSYHRPTEVDCLRGDASKAKGMLGWQARTSLEELVRIMVAYDLQHDEFGHPEVRSLATDSVAPC